jgi:hypothetical protein
MPVQQGSRHRWRLDEILGHVGRAQVWASCLGLQLGLHIDALFEQDPFQE